MEVSWLKAFQNFRVLFPGLGVLYCRKPCHSAALIENTRLVDC